MVRRAKANSNNAAHVRHEWGSFVINTSAARLVLEVFSAAQVCGGAQSLQRADSGKNL